MSNVTACFIPNAFANASSNTTGVVCRMTHWLPRSQLRYSAPTATSTHLGSWPTSWTPSTMKTTGVSRTKSGWTGPMSSSASATMIRASKVTATKPFSVSWPSTRADSPLLRPLTLLAHCRNKFFCWFMTQLLIEEAGRIDALANVLFYQWLRWALLRMAHWSVPSQASVSL